MGEKLFKVKATQGEIAAEQNAYNDWLAGVEPQDFGPIPYNAEAEKRAERERERWHMLAKEKEALASAELQQRILKQRMARENSPLLFKAMQTTGQQIREIVNRIMFHGKPCRRCGMTLRYLNSRRCVACNLAKDQRRRAANYTRYVGVAIDGRSQQYEGAPCSACGGRLRYLKTSCCVTCTKVHNDDRHDPKVRQLYANARTNRALAFDSGAQRYEGKPCRRCGCTTKYTRNSTCVQCHKNKQRAA